MKDNLNDIEKLFRETFETFESDVDPSVWTNISNQIGGQAPNADSSSAGTGGSGVGTGLGVGKIAMIVGAAGIISFGAYQLFSDDEVQSQVSDQKEEIVADVEENISNTETRDITDVIESEAISESTDISNPVSDADKESEQKIISSAQIKADEIKDASENNTTPKAVIVIPTPKSTPAEKPVEKKVEKAVVVSETTEKSTMEQESPVTFEASIYASVKSGKQPLEVYFENRGTPASDVLWKFRDGDESRSETVSHVFEDRGEYWVVLEIRDEKGHFSKDSTKISVEGRAYLDIPNTFSPNGDGINDEFKIEGDYIQTFEAIVMDRNQRVVYRWNDINSSWNGRDMNGEQVSKGVYFYIIKAIDMDGNMMKAKTGTVTVF